MEGEREAKKSEAMAAHSSSPPASQAPLRFDVTGSTTCSMASYDLDVANGETAIQIASSPSFCSSIHSSVADLPAASRVSAHSITAGVVTQDHSSRDEFVDILGRLGLEDAQRPQNDEHSGMLRWLHAMELHAVGACRTDERLRPLLRWNVSCFGADGRLFGRMGLHFKTKELAMLARCLCAPLVSLRVGKISCHGRILHPTARRGHLNLTMLPSSVLRLSFIEDSGSLERLADMTPCTEEPPIVLEGLSADTSSRSFVLKLPGSRLVFFWQSEKIKATGDELMLKMKDFLLRRPTLSQLTGIHESRLQSFASLVSTATSSPCPPATVSTRTSESAIIPAMRPCASREVARQAPVADSLVVPLPSTTSTSTMNTTTTTISAPYSVSSNQASGDRLSGAGVVDANKLEMERNAVAERLLASLPRTLVPFPLLVSSSAAGSLPTSRMIPASSPPLLTTTPCYCPCPISDFQCTSFTSPFLPPLPSASTTASELPSSVTMSSSSTTPLLASLFSLPLHSNAPSSAPFVSSLDEILAMLPAPGGDQGTGIFSSNTVSRLISLGPGPSTTVAPLDRDEDEDDEDEEEQEASEQ